MSSSRSIMVKYEISDEAECGYTYTLMWRELPWSMSWLRPGDKFDKRMSNLSKTDYLNYFNTKDGLDFIMEYEGTPGYVVNLPLTVKNLRR